MRSIPRRATSDCDRSDRTARRRRASSNGTTAVNMASPVAVSIVGVLPIFLTGALAVQVRDDLGFSESGLGLTVTVFFAAAALTSPFGGHIAERFGPRTGMRIGAGLTSIALCGVSMLATSLPILLGFVAVGGVGNAMGQPAVNLYLTRRVRAGSLGLAFGVKQAAIPTAAVLGGLAVPALALTVGWRWAYGIAGVAAIAIALAVPASAPSPPVERRPFHRSGDIHLSRLVLLALGHGLGSGAAGTLGAFLVSSAVDSGLGEGAAGVFGAGCAASGIVARVVTGAMADRRGSRHLTTVAAMLVLGSLALVALAVGAPPVMAVGGVGAYCLGWGWPGLLNFAIVQANPSAPGAATSITQTGAYLGGLLGPLAFGVSVQHWSYSVAWSATAVVMAGGAATVFAAHRLLTIDAQREARAAS